MHARPDQGITIHYRGLTLRLEEGDPRIVALDYLLLRDRPLPEAVPAAPPEPEPTPQPEPTPEPPAVEVPDAWLLYWDLLPEGARRMLALLCRQQLTTPQIEAALGMAPGTTRGWTIAIGHNARKAGLSSPMRGKRFGREKRLHYVTHEARDIVLELEHRWRKVDEALAQTRVGQPARRSGSGA